MSWSGRTILERDCYHDVTLDRGPALDPGSAVLSGLIKVVVDPADSPSQSPCGLAGASPYHLFP